MFEPGGRTTDNTVTLPVKTRDLYLGIRPAFDGGSVAEIGITRFVAGETPERTALRLAQRTVSTTDTAQLPTALAPIPLQSGGGRRA